MTRLLVLVLVFALPRIAGAQSALVRPALDWMTIRTRYFDVHYPAPMEEWARDLTTRIDAVHDAVSALVGYAPRARITVIVEDPLNDSNGFANSPLGDPLIVFWPTPPEPSGMLGTYRDWSELLAVHEYAHVAHLSRPSRSARVRWFWRFIPIRLGPVALQTPRWAVEGYATYVEGRLTGSGRPHAAARAAYLREWALEGKLPTYEQLSLTSGFAAGAMAYLAGSAFLEWLVEQRGDSSLVAVWRRLTARQPRTFTQAFAGVYGAPPDEMYGRFTVELTRRALAVHDTLAAAGLDTGVLVQRRRWSTGEPAVSGDGQRLAVELQSRLLPGPVVVWRTVERVDSARERRARERFAKLDPEDVPAIPGEPRPKVPIATLKPKAGRAFHSPRFIGTDSLRLLVSHDEPLGDGAYRRDLYEWNATTGDVRRITHGAGIHDADPLPDGRQAVAVQCENGRCDLVRVDLRTGTIVTIVRSTPATPFYRPRMSPDGRHAVVAVQHGGRWRLAIVAVDATALDGDADLTFVDPDDGANRYDAAFLPDGRRLVCVSDAGGVQNLELIALDGGPATRLTRITSAAFAPAPSPTDSAIYFLALHARGLDLRRISVTATTTARAIALSPSFAPAVSNRPTVVDSFARATLPAPHPYGAGPHQHRLLPGGAYSTEGAYASLSIVGLDPVGRFAYAATGIFGERSAWRGGSVTASWRGSRGVVPGAMSVDGTLYRAEQRPSDQRAYRSPSPNREFLDAAYSGATLGTATTRDYGNARLQLRVGGNLGVVDPPGSDRVVRGLAFSEARGAMRVRRGLYRLDLSTVVHASRGATDGLGFARAIGSVTADLATPFGGGRLDATIAGSDRGGGPFERFAIGGWPSPLVDAPVLSQRISMPVLPAGFAIGTHAKLFRASAALGPLRPYYWIGTTRENFTGWARVAGVDADYLSPAFPAFAIPAIGFRAGAGYSWDAPFRHRVGAYLGVTYRP